MADEPAQNADQNPQPDKPPKTPKPRVINCPNCNATALIHAKLHCPHSNKCTWRICKCGTTWDTLTGNHCPPIQG